MRSTVSTVKPAARYPRQLNGDHKGIAAGIPQPSFGRNV